MGIANRIYCSVNGVRKERRKVGSLDPPAGLAVEVGQAHGTMTLTWDKVKNAPAYLLEYGPVDGQMTQKPMVGPRKLTLSELAVGVTYQFRLSTLGGSTGQSYWSPWVKRAAA